MGKYGYRKTKIVPKKIRRKHNKRIYRRRKEFIGEENLDLLIEYNFNNDSNITSKKNLIEMLIALKGEKIFNEEQVRKEILFQFSAFSNTNLKK